MIADAFADDLLTSLKIIGMVGADQKLCMRNGRLALNTSGAFWRWLTGDSRNHTLQAVRTAVMSAIHAIENGTAAPWLTGRLHAELQGARSGIERLQETYAADSLAVAQLQVLAERIDAVTPP
jgi:hypothetical protein